MAIKYNVSQRTICRWLDKFNLQTKYKTYLIDLPPTKFCPICKQTKSRQDFYTFRKKYQATYCKECSIKDKSNLRADVKGKVVEYLGGCCLRCGYNKCVAALDIHHVDPSTKDKNYKDVYKFDDKLKLELDKCVLLCSNCHREEHYLHV